MWLAKWWTPDTIFVTVVGGVMAVVLSASLFSRPRTTNTGGSLVPAAVLESVRAQELDCRTIKNDMDLNLHANTRC